MKPKRNHKKRSLLLGAVTAAGVMVTPAVQGALIWTAQAPGVTSSPHSCVLVETFDSGTPSTLIGTYTGAFISGGDQFGGVGGSNYLDLDNANQSNEVTLDLNQTESYFGMWWSADSGGNTIQFFKGVVEVGSFDDSIFNSLGGAYLGNPEGPFAGQNSGEKYAFINFMGTDGTDFDKIVFKQTAGGGFESDNHTVRRRCSVPDGGSLMGVFSLAMASLCWARRKTRSS